MSDTKIDKVDITLPDKGESKPKKTFEWVKKHYAVLVTILFLISELLAEVPNIQASSLFQLVASALKSAAHEQQVVVMPKPPQ